jgi:RluA family pseudouridine synthase
MSDTAPLITQCPILHRDRFIVLVNKPACVLSHPNSARVDPKNRAAFEGRYDLDRKCFDGPAGKVWLIHRLDQDTSGVLLAALDEQTAEKCRALFEADAVRKHYLALVRGTLPPKDIWLDHLTTTRVAGRVRTTTLKGRPPNAELRYAVKGHHAGQRLTLLDIELITGRTHQIRVQASSRQHPLAGDDVYGDFDMNRRLRQQLGIKRLCLHARQLEFKHPASGNRLCIEAPLPEDLAGVLEALEMRL